MGYLIADTIATSKWLRSRMAKGLNACNKFNRNSPNLLALAVGSYRSRREKKNTVPGCIWSRRLRSLASALEPRRERTLHSLQC